MHRFFLPILTIALSLTASMQANSRCQAALVFRSQMQADFDASFLSSGPLAGYITGLGIPLDTFLSYEATGEFTFTLDDTDPTASSMAFTGLSGTADGSVPAPIFQITPFDFIGGTLDNITRNASGDITGGDINNLSARWAMIINPDPTDASLIRRAETLEGLPFSGSITGTPFGIGDVIAGPLPGAVDVYWDQDLNGAPAGVVQNRFLTAVPEPGTSGLLGLLLLGGVLRRRRS